MVFSIVLLVTFMLPWEHAALLKRHATLLGIARPAAVVAAVLTLCLIGVWRRLEVSAARPALAAAVGLFTGGAFSSPPPGGSRAYGAWIGLGAAIALVVVAMLGRVEMPRLQVPRLRVLATVGAAALLVTALFLPWQRECFERARGFGSYGGRCISTNGWNGSLGAAAALLAIGLVIVTTVSRRWFPPVVLAAGIGLLVATFGFGLSRYRGNGFRLEFGFGSTLGFVGAGLLLASVLAGVRPPGFGRERVPARLVPIAACVAYLFVVVVPWWGVLPLREQIALWFAPLSWLTIPGLLLALWLLQLWVDRICAAGAASNRLLIAPLALLALAALDLIRAREDVITWGRGIVVGACLLLCALGRIEQQVGLERVRVPGVLRVDRL
jgi:hypothetical protein